MAGNQTKLLRFIQIAWKNSKISLILTWKNNNLEIQLLPTIGGSNSTACSAPPPSWITNHAPEQQDTSSRHSISSP